MEDIKRINIVEDSGNFSNSLLSVINKNALNDTDGVANSPKSPVIVISDSEQTEDSVPKHHRKFQMRINNSNEALFVILPNSIICLICYKKFLRISLLKGHILWHLHRDDVSSNNLCRFCKSIADISECPSFKSIKRIMGNFLLSTVKNQCPSLENNSGSSGDDTNNNRVKITEHTTTEISNSTSHLDNNSSLMPSSITNNNKPKYLRGYQENFIEKAESSHQNKITKYEDGLATSNDNYEEPVIDSSEFILVNGHYKCLSCSKDYTRNTISSHVMWHFHKGVDFCSKLHYTSSSSGDTICPLVVQIINYLMSKEGKPIQVNWGKNSAGKIIFKVKLLKPAAELSVDTVVDDSIHLPQKNNVSSFQSDNTTPPVSECTVEEPLDQNHSGGIVTQNLTCNSEAGSSHSTDKSLMSEYSSDTPSGCHKTDESLSLDNNNQSMCTEKTDVTSADASENNLDPQLAKKSDSSCADAWGFYKCMVTGCNFSTLFPDTYLKHLKQFHENMNAYQCVHCNHTTDTHVLIAKHLKIHTHPTEFLFPCGSSDCSYYTRVLSLLPKHFTSSHVTCEKVLCKHCATEFTDINQLLEHYRDNLLKSVKCSYCPARDTLRQHILQHLALSHPAKPRQIIVSSQLVCNAKKQSLEHRKLLTDTPVNGMEEILMPELEQIEDIDRNIRTSSKYVNGLKNQKQHSEEHKTTGCSNEQGKTNGCSTEPACNGLSDFEQAQETIGVKMNQFSNNKQNSVKIKLKDSKDVSSIEMFNWGRETNGNCEQIYNNTFSVSNFINFDIAGQELDACLRICYEFKDQSLKCKLCFQMKESTEEIHHHILQDHFHWYLWQCFKCKENTYSLEEMHWHYQHKHQGFIICVKFLSLPQLAKGSDGKLCLQKEQRIVSVNSQKSRRTELYRQIQQQCAYEMVALRNSNGEEEMSNNKQRNKKLFIFLSDYQSVDDAEKIPDNKWSTDNLISGEIKCEKNNKHIKSHKRLLEKTSHGEIKKRNFSAHLNEDEIGTSNTHLRDEKDIKQDNKNGYDNNSNINELLLTVEKHLRVAQNSRPLKSARIDLFNRNIKTPSVKDKTVKHNQASLTRSINTSFLNSFKIKNGLIVNNNKVKISSNIEICKVKTGSAVEFIKETTDPDVEITMVKTGSPGDSKSMKPGSPVDNKSMKPGSTVDTKSMKTGSTDEFSKETTDPDVEITMVKTGSDIEISKMKTGSPVDSKSMKPDSTVDTKSMKPSSTVDSKSMKPGSTVDSKSMKTGLTVDSKSMKTGLTVDSKSMKTGLTVDSKSMKTGLTVDSKSMKAGSTVGSKSMKPGSTVDSKSMKSGSTVGNKNMKSGSTVGSKHMKTGSIVASKNIKADSPVDSSKMKTSSIIDKNNVETGSGVEISKGKNNSDIQVIMVKTGSPVDNKNVKTGSTVESKNVKTGSTVDSIKVKSRSSVNGNKLKIGSNVDSNKMKTHSNVDSKNMKTGSTIENKSMKAESPVDSSKRETSSIVESNKVKTDSNVGSNKVKTGSDVGVSKMKTGSDIHISIVKNNLDVKIFSKVKTSSTVGYHKVKSSSSVGISKMKTGLTVNTNKVNTDSTISSKKVKTGSPIEITKVKTSLTVNEVKSESHVNVLSNKKQSTVKNSHKRHLSSEVHSNKKKALIKCSTDSPDKKRDVSSSDSCRRMKNVPHFDISNKKDLSPTNISRQKNIASKSDSSVKYFCSSDTLEKNKTVTNISNSSKKIFNTTTCNVILTKANPSINKTLSKGDTSSKKTLSKVNTSVKPIQNTNISTKNILQKNISHREKSDTTSINNTGVVHRRVTTASKKGFIAVGKSSSVTTANCKKCKLCEFTSSKTFQMIKHMIVKHGQKYKDFITEREITRIKDAIVKNRKNKYVCPFCKYCCSSRTDCKLHVYHKHLHLRTMKCNQCMFFTRLPFQLRHHHLAFHLK